MIPIFVDGPAVEPITLPEMKAYLRIDHEAEDDLVAGLIKAARLMVEAASRRVLIEQRWRVFMDRWPTGGKVLLPVGPLLSVDAIKVLDAAGTASEVEASSIDVDLMGDPPSIIAADAPHPGKPRNGIEIELRAGFGTSPDAVPATLKLAIKILVAHWFENRGDVAGEQILPPEAMALVAPFQRVRL
ncbi:head-tail connector protein [Microvirga sp. ACRRW]|uniref:head-tail connector protein n=1 Tax=Microvirga sp. ACRRW TaxID=2918205 RepID=UPI001EF66E21|nr:head-tail connector protein [Microvirga sp. ACRRW]MCG7392558.1 head-tail connector protein [Microvirga sp. ACRRW]